MKAKLKFVIESELKQIEFEIEKLSNTEIDNTHQVTLTKHVNKLEKMQERKFKLTDALAIIDGSYGYEDWSE